MKQTLFSAVDARFRRNSAYKPRRGGILGALIVCLVIAGILGGIGYAVFYKGGDGLNTGELISAPVIE
ncbi:MAG: hypothetical protein KDB00_13985, partial [Planctomycetales bacterium]|nr:hypothetical protein [Planctomycetales bacterium]